MADLPLEGSWKVYRSGNAAATIIPQEVTIIDIRRLRRDRDEYEIHSRPREPDSSSLTEQRDWKVEIQSQDHGLIRGHITPEDSVFVMTLSKDCEDPRKLVGVIFKQNCTGDDDPGIWEAEEGPGGGHGDT